MPGAGGPVEDVARVENRTLPGPAGEIPVRIYAPEPSSAAFPRWSTSTAAAS